MEGVHRCGVNTAAVQSGQGLGFLATTLAAKISEERIEHIQRKLCRAAIESRTR